MLPVGQTRGSPQRQVSRRRSEPLPLTIFDGDAYILHHWATRYKIPYRFLGIINPTNIPIREMTPREVVSKLNIFQSLVLKGVSLKEISRQLFLGETDSAMIYALISLNQRNVGRLSRGLPPLTMPDKTELTIINDFVEAEMKLHTFLDQYLRWWKKYNEDVANHWSNIMGLDVIRNIINSVPFLSRSPLSVSKVSIIGYPVWSSTIPAMTTSKKQISSQDGLDIFNTSKVSFGIPYIELDLSVGQRLPKKLGTSGIQKGRLIKEEPLRSIYKIYHLGKSRMSSDYSRMIRDSSTDKLTKKEFPNRIKMTVWSGVGDVSSAPKDSFLPVNYNLDTNNLKLTVPTISKKWQTSTEPEIGSLLGATTKEERITKTVQSRILSALPSIQVK